MEDINIFYLKNYINNNKHIIEFATDTVLTEDDIKRGLREMYVNHEGKTLTIS